MRVGVAGLDQLAGFGAQHPHVIRGLIQGDDVLGEFRGVARDQDVQALGVVDALGTDRRTDHRLPQSHAFDDLHAHAASGEQGHHHHIAVPHERLRVLHTAADVHTWEVELKELVRHLVPCQVQSCLGACLQHLGPHLVKQPAYAFFVRQPIHASQVEEADMVRWFSVLYDVLRRLHREGDGDDRGVGAVLGEVLRIGRTDRGHGIHAVQHGHLVLVQLFGEEFPVGPLQEVLLACGDPALDHMFEVVRPQHDRGLRIAPDRGDVRRHEQALQLHHIELLFGEQTDQADIHVRGEEATDVVIVSREQVREGIHHVHAGIHEHTFDPGAFQIVGRYLRGIQHVLRRADAQHLHRMSGCHQASSEVVHGLAAAVDGRVRRFIAQLEDAHGRDGTGSGTAPSRDNTHRHRRAGCRLMPSRSAGPRLE